MSQASRLVTELLGLCEEVGSVACGEAIESLTWTGDPKDHSNGAFAEHIKSKIGIQLKFGENISFEDAATLGVGISTVGQGLYQALGLPLPPAKVEKPTPLLIYGGSTATGTLAIQFAKLSGAEVYATSSPRNFDLLRKLGADHVFDYNEGGVGKKIREAAGDNLKLAFDCISEHNSPQIIADALSSTGGHVSTLLKIKDFPRDDVKVGVTLA